MACRAQMTVERFWESHRHVHSGDQYFVDEDGHRVLWRPDSWKQEGDARRQVVGVPSQE